MDKPTERRCPSCGVNVAPIPIVYGMPTYETFQEEEAGKLKLGGCCVTDDDPEWACPACDAPIFESEEQRQRYQRSLAPDGLP